MREVLVVGLVIVGLMGCGEDSSSGTVKDAEMEVEGGDDATEDAVDDAEDAEDVEVEPDAVDSGGDAADEEPEFIVEGALDVGPFRVGFQRHELTYRPVDAAEDRTIRVVIWYPTEDTTGEPAYYADILPRPEIFDNASVALDAPAPVMIFTHGSQAVAEQSWTTMEFFASHGWIVVAPDHPGNTLFDMGEPLAPYFVLRPQDVHQAIDYIDALTSPHSLAGLFSDDRIIAGHSFGGYTTMSIAGATYDVDALGVACLDFEMGCEVLEAAREQLEMGYADPRVKAAIPMTPGGFVLFGEAGVAAVDLPVLLMTSGMDNTLPEEEEGDRFWAALDGPDDVRVVISRGGHLTYSNLCEVVPDFGRDDGCGPDAFPAPKAHIIINTYMMAFARYHLFGDESLLDLLEKNRSLDEGVEVYTK